MPGELLSRASEPSTAGFDVDGAQVARVLEALQAWGESRTFADGLSLTSGFRPGKIEP